MASCVTPEPQEIRAELERILASAPFTGSHRSQQFLRYVVDNSLENRETALKEYSIAIEVFEREPTYDPSIDATVRVEAGRLRTRLREYYRSEGQNDPLIIEIPKGGYRAVFSERSIVDKAVSTTHDDDAARSMPLDEQQAGRSGFRVLTWALAAVFAVGVILGWAIFTYRHHPQPAARSKDAIRLAVLPFSNETGTAANDYLSNGLTDNLIRQLSDLPRLHVMARAAVDRVTRDNAADKLGVAVLLTGSLQRNADGHLTLNMELSSAKDGTVLRSREYLADPAELPSVQADVVSDVIQGLGIELDARQAAGARRPITSNAAAFQAYLRGELTARDPSPPALHEAIRYYQEATVLDPQFALAYASIAGVHALLGLYYEPPREHMPLARQYAEHAIALDSTQSNAHGTLGLVHLVYDWDFGSAAKEFAASDARDSAIRTLSCTAHLHLLGSGEHMRHAEEDLYRMLEFNPHSASLIGELGCLNYYAARYEDAVRRYREAIAADPQAALSYWGLGRSLALEGRYSEALDALHKFRELNGSEPPLVTAEIGYSEAASGNRRGALETIRQLERESTTTYVDPYLIAMVYLALKDSEQTYAWLDKAYEERSPFLVSIETDPKWSAARNDHRFEEIWNRMMLNGQAASAGNQANVVHTPAR